MKTLKVLIAASTFLVMLDCANAQTDCERYAVTPHEKEVCGEGNRHRAYKLETCGRLFASQQELDLCYRFGVRAVSWAYVICRKAANPTKCQESNSKSLSIWDSTPHPDDERFYK